MGSTLAELKTAMKCLKSEMKAMEAEVGKVPFPESSLEMKLGSVEYYWGEVRNFYDRLQVLSKHEQAEVEPIASGKLQARYRIYMLGSIMHSRSTTWMRRLASETTKLELKLRPP